MACERSTVTRTPFATSTVPTDHQTRAFVRAEPATVFVMSTTLPHDQHGWREYASSGSSVRPRGAHRCHRPWASDGPTGAVSNHGRDPVALVGDPSPPLRLSGASAYPPGDAMATAGPRRERSGKTRTAGGASCEPSGRS